MWLLVGFFDTIIKAFQYGYVILVPMILIIIFYSNKKRKIKNISNHDTSELTRLSNIVNALIIIVVLLVFTSRIWGPPLYKHIIAFSIANQESEIEEKLEKNIIEILHLYQRTTLLRNLIQVMRLVKI